MKVLVTGAAGFIGAGVCTQLLTRGDTVVGLDNLNDYYDVSLKEARLARLRTHAGFEFAKADVGDGPAVANVFGAGQFDRVVHLAAQAGVRYSIDNPVAYAQSNLLGFTHILEGCRHHEVEHLVYASSSSVYGANTELPFAEHHNVDHPVSFYAASKKANELMAHSYSHLYQLPVTGLRYFTVYGPWGRPDMALFKFTRNILCGPTDRRFQPRSPSSRFHLCGRHCGGHGPCVGRPAAQDGRAAARVYNIGNNNTVELAHFIEVLEQCLRQACDKKPTAAATG